MCYKGRPQGRPFSLMRAPDAAQRVALREAVRCRAGAPVMMTLETGVPALRSGMKNAAPRPGHEKEAYAGRQTTHRIAKRTARAGLQMSALWRGQTVCGISHAAAGL